jgi:hypothetical protein
MDDAVVPGLGLESYESYPYTVEMLVSRESRIS